MLFRSEQKADQLASREQEIRRCIATLREMTPVPTAEVEPKKRAAPKPRQETAKPKSAKPKSAKPKTAKAKAAPTDDAPQSAKGRLPRKGVQQLYCEDEPTRKAKVSELKAEGYTRVSGGQPLTAKTYDVRPSGDGDQSSVVLWREAAAN